MSGFEGDYGELSGDPFNVIVRFEGDDTVLTGRMRLPVNNRGEIIEPEDAKRHELAGGYILVRDSKDVSVDPVVISKPHWARFIGMLASGEVGPGVSDYPPVTAETPVAATT